MARARVLPGKHPSLGIIIRSIVLTHITRGPIDFACYKHHHREQDKGRNHSHKQCVIVLPQSHGGNCRVVRASGNTDATERIPPGGAGSAALQLLPKSGMSSRERKRKSVDRDRARDQAAHDRERRDMYQMRAELAAGSRMPEHAHPQEQIAHVVRGRMKLIVAGVPTRACAGRRILSREQRAARRGDNRGHDRDRHLQPAARRLSCARRAGAGGRLNENHFGRTNGGRPRRARCRALVRRGLRRLVP